MTLLIGKAVVSVAVVLALAWLAEHVNARVAGIVSGMPLGGVLVLAFVGLEQGPAFAAQSAHFAVPSIIATLAFAFGYYFGSHWGGRLSPLTATLLGLIGYFAIAGPLSLFDLGLLAGVGLALTTLVVVARLSHSREANRIENRVPMTAPRLLFRAGTAAAIVVAITTFAELLGPRWSGLLIGFPMTFLPFLLVIHITYSAEHVRTIIRNFPLGLVGLVIFLAISTLTIPALGVALAIPASLGGSLLYLSVLAIVLSRQRPARAAA